MCKQIKSNIFNKMSLELSHDFDSFKSLKKVYWQDFTILHFEVQRDGYARHFGIYIAIFGLHACFTIWRRLHEERKKETDEFLNTKDNK